MNDNVSQKKHGLRRRLVSILTFSVLGFFVACVLIELGFRGLALIGKASSSDRIESYCIPTDVVPLRAGEDFTGFYQFDENVGRRWVPGVRGINPADEDALDVDYSFVVYAANEHGWRDVPRTLEKPSGTYRIAVIGDSFTTPSQRHLEEGIPQQLEAWLNDQGLAQNVEVLSFSLPGNRPLDYSRLVQYEAPRYDVDLIVVSIYTYNDVRSQNVNDVVEVDGRIIPRPEGIEGAKAIYEQTIASPAEDGSLTWEELEIARNEGRLVVTYEAPDGTRSYAVQLKETRNDIPPGLEVHCFLQRISRAYTWLTLQIAARRPQPQDPNEIRDADNMEAYAVNPNTPMEEAWELHEQLLVQMADDAEAQGAQIAFVTLPVTFEVYPDVFDKHLSDRNATRDDYDPTLPMQRTQAACEGHQLNCWFMLPVFIETAATSDEPLYDYYDPRLVQVLRSTRLGHNTRFGYGVIAQAIGENILEAGWIPRES